MTVSAGVAASSGNALWGSQKCRLVYVKTGYAHVNPLGVSSASVSYGPNGSVSPVFQLANIRIILNTSNNHLKFAGEFGRISPFLSSVTRIKTIRPSTICRAVCEAMSRLPKAAPVRWNCSALTGAMPEAARACCRTGRKMFSPNRRVVW